MSHFLRAGGPRLDTYQWIRLRCKSQGAQGETFYLELLQNTGGETKQEQIQVQRQVVEAMTYSTDGPGLEVKRQSANQQRFLMSAVHCGRDS